MKKFVEFTCMFDNGIDLVTGEPNYSIEVVCIDLSNVIAFNPFTLYGYTVLRMSEGTSFIVEQDYEQVKSLFTLNTFFEINLS